MPFTFAHPAAVLPLRRFKPLQTVPLMVGSVTPDLPYYVFTTFNKFMWATHTPWGSVFLDIPLGLAVLIAGFFLRRPLTVLLPPRLRALCLRSMQRFEQQRWHWLWAPLSIFVGVWTHIAWDAFTHENGWMARHLPILAMPVTFGDYTGMLCHVLQYVSSVVGLLILALWYRSLRKLPDPPAVDSAVSRSGRMAILSLVVAAAICVGAFVAGRAELANRSHYRVIYLGLTRSIMCFVGLYVIAGFFVMYYRKKPEPVAEV